MRAPFQYQFPIDFRLSVCQKITVAGCFQVAYVVKTGKGNPISIVSKVLWSSKNGHFILSRFAA